MPKSLKKMFHHDRDYEPYDPTPVKVISPWRDSESMEIPGRPLFNMSNLEQRKMFTHLASVPIKAMPDVVIKEYNPNQGSKEIIWTIHARAKFNQLNISDLLRVNRVASLPASETSDVLLVSITDRKGKIRVYENRRFLFKQLTRVELAESIQFSSNKSLELANAVRIIEKH